MRLRHLFVVALASLCLPGATSSGQTDTVEYYHLDAAGNVRAVTNQAGQVIERHDYLPFGEEWCPGPPPGVCGSVIPGQPKRFTGKERDAETGLDYFGARYYGSRIGRFTTVDPVYTWRENLVDPQRWNRYAYARNNPLRYVDPDGREITYASSQLQTFFNFLSARSEVVWGTLALYAGPNNPDLTISQRGLGSNADGPTAGLFTPSFDFTTDYPPGSGTFDRLGGMSQDEIQAALANGSLYTSATLKGATLELDSSLNLGITSLGRSKQEQQSIGVGLHELGHAESAARNPLGHFRLSLPINQMEKGKRQEHDKRQVERDANQYRDGALRDFPK